MIKKCILGALVALTIPSMVAYAATPMFSVSGSGSGNATVQVTGDPNASVNLFYFNPSVGVYQPHSLGMTNASGTLSSNFNASMFSNFNVDWNRPVYVQVGGYESARIMWPYTSLNSSTSGGVMFSNMSPNMAVGQNGTVTLSGGSGSYYVASNSNTSGVTPTISGNTLNLYGAAAGQAMITVCSNGGGCGTLTTTVSGNGSPTLSSSNLNVNSGSQGQITLSGGTAPYTVSVLNGTGVSTTLIGNTLYVNGNATGTNMLNVCSANGGACSTLNVNVQAQSNTNTNTNTNTNANTGTNTGNQMSFTLPLTMGQVTQLHLSGGTGGYYLQSPVTSPALASISGNTLMLNGSAMGSGTVTVCQTGSTSCLPISFTVNQAANMSTNTSLTGTGGGWLFDADLSIDMSGQAVLELQKRLLEEGHFTVAPTGYFGPITARAVMKYQAAHGIATTGYVGPLTRAELNR